MDENVSDILQFLKKFIKCQQNISWIPNMDGSVLLMFHLYSFMLLFNINWRDVQRKNVVNKVKCKGTMTKCIHNQILF